MPLGEVKVVKSLSAAALKPRDAYICFTEAATGKPTMLASDALPAELASPMAAMIAKEPLKPDAVRLGAVKAMGFGIVAHLAPSIAAYNRQGALRRIVEAIVSHGCLKPVIFLDQYDADRAMVMAEELAVAFSLGCHSYSKHGGANPIKKSVAAGKTSAAKAKAAPTSKKVKSAAQKSTKAAVEVLILAAPDQQRAMAAAVTRGLSHGTASNAVRDLVMAPSNIIDTAGLKKVAQATARAHGLKFSFYGKDKLEKLKAGAFLAVAQGSAEKDFGIAKLSYTPAKASHGKTKVALVGKGIVFDTGGVNLKPGQYMAGMKGDMGGAATVLGIIQVAAAQGWPLAIDAYLAISDNAIDGKSYRPDEVVTAMNGTTIEIIDTDAEGRMVLADTLSLCAESQPDMILDFATLTGANSRAVGRKYAGGYTNRDEWVAEVIAAGKASGERVWPFPMDADYGDSLKSTVADVKQCSSEPGPDHIEAAQLLSRFVPDDIPWLHIDLSCSNVSQAFGYFPRGATGFGLGFAAAFLRRVGFLPDP